MPPRKINDVVLANESEEMISLNSIPTVESSMLEIDERLSGRINAPEWEFSWNLEDIIPISGLTRADLFLVFACGYSIDKIKQNNWRKLHGLAMKRRIFYGSR